MAKTKEKWPPQISASKAITIVTRINNSYGKSVNGDLVAPFLECSRKSSYFGKRISALADFGLVTYGRDIVSLTALALKIAAPVSEEEQQEAVMESFNSIQLLRDLYNRYPGGHLPSRENLQNLLVREYEIPRENVDKWADFVEESFEVVSKFRTVEAPAKQGESEPQPDAPARAVARASQALPADTISIPLKKGQGRMIIIPNDFTADELTWFNKWFEVWENRPE